MVARVNSPKPVFWVAAAPRWPESVVLYMRADISPPLFGLYDECYIEIDRDTLPTVVEFLKTCPVGCMSGIPSVFARRFECVIRRSLDYVTHPVVLGFETDKKHRFRLLFGAASGWLESKTSWISVQTLAAGSI